MLVMYASEIVESGPVEEVFAFPGHPYTEALLRANPGLAAKGNRLDTIPGHVPSPFEEITGCRFQDRCSLVEPRCRLLHPPLEQIAERHIRCVLAGQRINSAGGIS